MNLHRLLSAARRGRPADPGRADRLRQVRHHVPRPGAAAPRGCTSWGSPTCNPERARRSLQGAGWPEEQLDAPRPRRRRWPAAAPMSATTRSALIAASGLDVLVEATGDPRAGVRHALAAIEHGRHLVMVNVEADVLVGPLLAERARKAGLVYSLAYGDQPALICEMVDWARASGFDGGLRRQGHALPAAFPPVDAGHGLDPFRHHRRAGRGRRHEPQDVQQLRRRHQVGDRDGRGRQRHRPRAAGARALVLPLRHPRSRPRAAARRAWAASSSATARSR